MEATEKAFLADILQVTMGTMPLKHLGLPISGVRWDKLACNALLEKIVARLKAWSSRGLSYAGRVQLVNTVLMSITNYWSSVFQLPQSVHIDIRKMCRDHIWGQEEGKRGFYPVAWDTVTRSKK